MILNLAKKLVKLLFSHFLIISSWNINIKGALKFFDKHTISLELASGLNILPSIYKQGDHIKNTKNFYTTYQNGLNKKILFRQKILLTEVDLVNLFKD